MQFCCTQTAFFHKASQTLLVTDAVVYVSEDPPEVGMLHLSYKAPISVVLLAPAWNGFSSGLTSPALAQVINRAKLQRAGKDNLFVRLLYGKDTPRNLQSMEEQEKVGECRALVSLFLDQHQVFCMSLLMTACTGWTLRRYAAVHTLRRFLT